MIGTHSVTKLRPQQIPSLPFAFAIMKLKKMVENHHQPECLSESLFRLLRAYTAKKQKE